MRSRRPPRPDPDDAAVTLLYEQYAGDIAAYALRRARGIDAADVVADTFLVAWRRRTIVPAEPDTLPWLYGVARRVLANQRRSRDRRSRLDERLRTQLVDTEILSADRVDDSEEFRRVALALSLLSESDAELLRLTAWEGLGPTEIATVMCLEPSAVRQRLRRARQRLRDALAREADDSRYLRAVVASTPEGRS